MAAPLNINGVTIDDDKWYTVTVTRPIELTPSNFAPPEAHIRMRGDMVRAHAADITNVVETTES